MPLELIKCPKCGGKGSQIDKDNWKCVKCGFHFIYTQPPEVVLHKVIGETTVQPKKGPIGWIIMIVVLAILGAVVTWKMVVENQGGSGSTTQPTAR